MLVRLLSALAVLAGKSDDMPRHEAFRIARQFGYTRGGSGGGIRRLLNLRGMPAFNEHCSKPRAKCFLEKSLWGEESPDLETWRQNRNAAKAQRRARRAA